MNMSDATGNLSASIYAVYTGHPGQRWIRKSVHHHLSLAMRAGALEAMMWSSAISSKWQGRIAIFELEEAGLTLPPGAYRWPNCRGVMSTIDKVPEWRLYDFGDEFADQYRLTVYDKAIEAWDHYGMSTNADAPNGVNMYYLTSPGDPDNSAYAYQRIDRYVPNASLLNAIADRLSYYIFSKGD